MRTREGLRQYLVENGVTVSRFRNWEEAARSEERGLLYERRPSGYASWFAFSQDKIWWIYSDSSDGGVWSQEGIQITGHGVPYDRDIVRNIYALAKPSDAPEKK